MMKLNKKVLLLSFMSLQVVHIQPDKSLGLFAQQTDSLSDVLGKYETALGDFIQVYQEQSPPMPIQFVSSDIVGSTFDKIIHPYVVELTGLASVVMSGFVRKYPYYKDLQIMHTKFRAYQQKVKALSKKFPSKQQVVAQHQFYKQLVPVVQTCAQIVRGITDELNISDESIQAAQSAFEIAWQAQTENMKLHGFADIASFQSAMINGMISLYNTAINKTQESITNEKNIEDTLKKIASYYQAIEKVYSIAGKKQQAAVAKQNYDNAHNNVQAFFDAGFTIKEADKKAEEGRVALVIDFEQPENTKKALSKSLSDLQITLSLYQQVEKLYAKLGYGAGIQLLQARMQEIQGDQHVRAIQLLWTMLLQDQYRSGVSSDKKVFGVLQDFYRQDPTKQSENLNDVIYSLEQMIDLMKTVPNMFSPTLSLQPLVTGALQLYQDASSQHPDGTSKDRLADMELLHTVQDVYADLLSLMTNMRAVTKAATSSSLLLTVGFMLEQAADIDKAFDKEQSLKDLCVYLPNLDVSSQGHQKTFTSFVIQYLYRICLIRGMSYMKKASESDQSGTSDMVEALTYFMFIQQYKHHLQSQQIVTVEQLVEQASQGIDISSEAHKVYVKAEKNNDWSNKIVKQDEAGVMYQSNADTLWKKAIHMYEIALQIQPSITLRRDYVTVLQNYIKAYRQNVATYNGYQLHMVTSLYKLYLGAVELNNDQMLIDFVKSMMAQLFGSDTGLFGQFTQLAHVVTDSQPQTTQTASSQKVALQNLEQLVSRFHKIYTEESFIIPALQRLFITSENIKPCLDYVDNSDTIALSISIGTIVYHVQVANPQVIEMKHIEAEAEKLFDAAQQATIQQKFVNAQGMYKNILALYSKIIHLARKNSDIKTYNQKLFLAKTRYAACNVAARIQFAGSQSVGTMLGIPEKYYVSEYQIGIDIKQLELSMPTSLASIKGATVQKLETDDQRQDAIALYKAFLLDKLLQQQGLRFKDCYTNYQFAKKSGLGKTDIALANKAEKTAQEYVQDFDKTVIFGAIQGTTVTLKLENMPLPAVAPLYQAGSFAALYLLEAATLFKPGTKLISVGGVSYVPGQDEDVTNLLYEDIAYAYVADAQKHITVAQTDLQEVVTKVTVAVKAGNKITLSDVAVMYDSAKKSFIRAQALLYASGGSAYYYFIQAKKNQKAQLVRQTFLSLYKSQVEMLTKLVTGNPLSNLYSTVIGDINQAYVSWNSELDPNNSQDSEQIENNKKAIVNLYVAAAQDCMNYSYKDPMFPQFAQKHYMKASANFKAAYQEYAATGDSAKAAQMMEKVLHAEYQACNQDIALYFWAKQHGVVYTPTAMFGSGKQNPQKISIEQLNRNYQNFSQSGANINSGELEAYNTVKKMLLDASMFYQYIGSQYAKLNPEPQEPPKPPSTKQQTMNPKLIAYLQQKNIVEKNTQVIQYNQPGIIQKLFNIADTLYEHFKKDNEVLTAWTGVLNVAVAHLYINDYLGGSTGDQDFAAKWQAFFQAVRKEGSSLQNPASEYVG